ncbi:hypothetical protein GDO78_008304 [Eleutherodactylus coqui]|uniref:Uncharacterized protein n=1 Tax=Eleutherodactylus coqui TaxID=57060 RepID=A0A8J6FD37_ELECQ|nr:hypothetical protein GDO78_008304 [Eleutherodactylus coqui]
MPAEYCNVLVDNCIGSLFKSCFIMFILPSRIFCHWDCSLIHILLLQVISCGLKMCEQMPSPKLTLHNCWHSSQLSFTSEHPI